MDVQLPDGTMLRGVPDGTSKADLMAKLSANGYDTAKLEPAVSAGKAINQTTGSIPRQLGLAARYEIEGLADASQLVTEPLRYVTDRLTGNVGKTKPMGALASDAADWLGLPSPETPTERTVAGASKLVAGTGATMGLGQLAQRGGQMAQEIGKFFTQQPVTQLAAAAGSGLAGGASKEAGGSTGQQVSAAVLGGLGGAGVAGLGGAVAGAAKSLKNSMMGSKQMDVEISLLLGRAGVDYSEIPERARQALRAELSGALRAEKELDPAAVARLLDFKRNGLAPTRGMVSLDPVQITREQNLAKMAANSSDDVLHGLPRLQNQNNAKLIQNLNESGASRGNIFEAGESAIGGIQGRDAAMGKGVDAAYASARSLPGSATQLERKGLIDSIYANLDEKSATAFLPESVSEMLDQISAGTLKRNGQDISVPFDGKAIDNLMTIIATEQRSAKGSEKIALSAVRKALDGMNITPVKPVVGGNTLVTQDLANQMRNFDGQAETYLDALRGAKQTAAKRFDWQESGNPIKAALGGAQPDDFIKRFVIGGTVKDAKDVAANAPPEEIKNAIVAHLKAKALSGAEDDIGKFSQSAFNREMKAMGRKLPLFFSKDEIGQLESMGRAASYMQAQPVGSAVNNSNSGAMVIGKAYDALRGGIGMIPGVGPVGAGIIDVTIGTPTKNASNWLAQRQAQNLMQGLLAEQKQPMLGGLGAASVAMGGLLAAPRLP